MRLQGCRNLSEENGILSIGGFYRGEGFLSSSVEGSIDTSRAAAGRVDLAIRIQEGPQWHLTRLNLRVPRRSSISPALRDTLLSVLQVRPPGPYRLSGIVQDRMRLYGELAARAYLDAAVEVEANRSDSCWAGE